MKRKYPDFYPNEYERQCVMKKRHRAEYQKSVSIGMAILALMALAPILYFLLNWNGSCGCG